MVSVAVSILSHGQPAPTIDCLHSLLAAAEKHGSAFSMKVFVADNGSVGPDRDALDRAVRGLQNVMLLLNERNIGFAAGHNRNVETILAQYRPDYIWLLNNDCVVRPGCVDALLHCANKHPDVGIWGLTLLEPDGQTIQCAGGCQYNSWFSSFRPHGRGMRLAQMEELQEVPFDYIAGAALFFPIRAIEHELFPPETLSVDDKGRKLTLLNEEFFLYFEELDLAKRLRPAFRMGWCRDAHVVHAGGESTGTSGRQRSAQAEHHSTLSALKFTRLYYPARLWFMAPARYLAKVIQLLFTGNARLIASLNAAYREFWIWLHEH